MRPDIAALVVALAVTAPARAADVAAGEDAGAALAARDVATLAARESLLGEQADTARASARWRLRALYRLAVAGGDLPPLTRSRALAAGARALARELDEARALAAERGLAHAEREARVAAARAWPVPGAAPAIALPVTGAVLSRFGVAPQGATGLLLSRAGVRLAARAGQEVRAPAAAAVARVAPEPDGDGWAVVLELGPGWTAVVGGLAQPELAQGARLVAGQPLGVTAGSGVTFELWRGRRPVDPLLLARTPSVP